MTGRFSFLFPVALFVACTSATKPPRIFSEDYIEGVYGRFFELTEEGNSVPCPMVIDHFKRGTPSAMGNSWIVPHDKIVQNGALCDDRGALVLNPYNQSSAMPPPVRANKIAEKTFELMKHDSTGFWMGPDSRTCGKWVFPNPSFIFFVREFDRHIQSFFNLDLAPGKKYMFVVAPSFTCIYEDIPRSEQSDDVISTSNDSNGEETNDGQEAASTPGKPAEEAGTNPGSNFPASSEAPEAADDTNDPSDTDGPTGDNDGSDEGEPSETPPDGLSIIDIANGAEPLPATLDPGSGNLSIVDIAPDVPSNSGEEDQQATSSPDTTDDTSEDSNDDSGNGEDGDEDGETISDINNGSDGDDNETSFGVDSVSGESLCFPGDAKVELLTGSVVQMDRLAIGDKVRVASNKFSAVFMFTHKLEAEIHWFVQLTTLCRKRIRLTAGHLLYVNGALKRAGHARVGDTLLTADGKKTRVMNVSTVRARGVYNPQTMHGDIIVDGIVASTYTTTVAPQVAHGALAPLRAVWNAIRRNAMGSVLESHSLSKDVFSLLQSDITSHGRTEL